jgi:hypothetical protein
MRLYFCLVYFVPNRVPDGFPVTHSSSRHNRFVVIAAGVARLGLL